MRFFDPTGLSPVVTNLAIFHQGSRNFEVEDGTISEWRMIELGRIILDIQDVAKKYAQTYNSYIYSKLNSRCDIPFEGLSFYPISPERAFFRIHGGQMHIVRTMERSTNYWGNMEKKDEIHIYETTSSDEIIQHPRFIIHELGHAFERSLEKINQGHVYTARESMYDVPELFYERDLNAGADGVYDCGVDDPYCGFYGGSLVWQFSRDEGPFVPAENTDGRGEIFADMFVGWTYSMWASSDLGETRSLFMDEHMTNWIFEMVTED